MKVSASIKKRCKMCKIVKREGRLYVICTNPRHKTATRIRNYRMARIEGVGPPAQTSAFRLAYAISMVSALRLPMKS